MVNNALNWILLADVLEDNDRKVQSPKIMHFGLLENMSYNIEYIEFIREPAQS